MNPDDFFMVCFATMMVVSAWLVYDSLEYQRKNKNQDK
jgi:hypothetical protein